MLNMTTLAKLQTMLAPLRAIDRTAPDAAARIWAVLEPLDNVWAESRMTDETRREIEAIRFNLSRAGLYTYAEE